jgi:UV excision repair protein RAD23
VLTVKEKIKELQGHDIELQKLIYSGMCVGWTVSLRLKELTVLLGKILADDQTIESYNITEKNFVVCMISKVRRFAFCGGLFILT